MMEFSSLGLATPLLRSLADAGYQRPTPIQQLAIPPALERRDIVGCAQTGTGKTAAFTLPVLQHLDRVAGDKPVLRALVVTPTRELAAQISESFGSYGRHLDLWHTVIFGGVSDKRQIQELRRGVDAIIATPGRLLDLMSRGEIDLSEIEVFVLDEADRMLDMGFLPDVRRIIQKLPEDRHTLFFSATMPPEVRKLAEGLLRDPVAVNAARVSAPAEAVDQRLYFVDKSDKRRLLVDVLEDAAKDVAKDDADKNEKVLVFSRTKHGANRIVRMLDRARIDALAIHGNKSQGARVRALEQFRSGQVGVLVATDIAARGIDVEGITHVINFDLPNVPETYVHRIGRTARAGASGLALSFCDTEEREYLVDIERLIGRHIARVEDHDHPPTQPPPPETSLDRNVNRRSGKPKSKRSAARRSPRAGRRSRNNPHAHRGGNRRKNG